MYVLLSHFGLTASTTNKTQSEQKSRSTLPELQAVISMEYSLQNCTAEQ